MMVLKTLHANKFKPEEVAATCLSPRVKDILNDGTQHFTRK